MMKITKIATVIIIVLTISLCASKLLPQSKEIDQMEIIKVVGLDYEDTKEDGGKATVSFTMEKDDSSGDDEMKSVRRQRKNQASDTPSGSTSRRHWTCPSEKYCCG